MTSIRYGQRNRWADSFQGWRDGRAGIPARQVTGAPPGPATTPHREALIRQARDSFAYEYLEYHRLAAEPHRRTMAEQARLEAAESALTWATLAADMESGPLAEVESRRRRLGEEHHPETVIVQRRHQEQRKFLARAQAAVTRTQADVAAIAADLAQALEEARQQHQAAVVRVQRIHEHVHRRLAVYRRALVRAHPDGAWVNVVLSVQAPEIPGWALPDAYAPDSLAQRPPVPDNDEPEITDEPAVPSARIIPLRHQITRFGSGGPEAPVAADAKVGYETLPSPIAAAWHFTITKAGTTLQLQTRGYGHGPYIGEEVDGTAVLEREDFFDFAEDRYTMIDTDHLRCTPLGQCDLVVSDLFARSETKTRLSGMSFVQREKTLLAVLGPSGAGKSSLFQALIGELRLESGRLFFQNMSMRTQSAQIRKKLGFVPQKTDLHESLTVEATLRYGFGLRSPARKKERNLVVARVLKDLSLTDQRQQLLSTLSGGQLRRVSIALELLIDPPLLLLDEPTSGLDANMDRMIMTFLRQHAEQGHTVIVVTHATEHLPQAHQIVVVVDNGAPAYSGPPRQIRKYFGFRSYADLMSMLLTQSRQWADKYRDGRLALDAGRRADQREQEIAEETAATSAQSRRWRIGPPRAEFHLFGVLLRRQALLVVSRGRTRGGAGRDKDRKWLRHKVTGGLVIVMPLLIALVSALLAAKVAGRPGLGATPSPTGPRALTLLTTLCVLSGQALTYSDVVNELPIIGREFRAGVGAFPVLAAKWLVYAMIAVAQAGLITVLYCLGHRGPQRFVLYSPETDLFIGLAMLTLAAMTLGLLVSTLAKKLETAVAIVTLTSIAQIALNGVTSGLAKVSVIALIAWPLPDRWGLAAAASSIDLRGINARSGAAQVSPDRLWYHSSGQWLTDLAVLAVLSMLFFTLAVIRLHVRLRPKAPFRRPPA
jgi:ABC transport system ATP-binding/permease protein